MRLNNPLSFLASLAILLFLREDPGHALDEKLLNSIVLLSSSGGCGTGFYTASGAILTTNHLVEALCSHGVCQELEIGRGKSIDGGAVEKRTTTLTVQWRFPEYDVAALTESGATAVSGYFATSSVTPLVPGEEVFTLGFAHCNVLTLSAGPVQDISPIDAETRLRVQAGMSGAPVFTGKGPLVGIVHGAASLLGRTLAEPLSRPFDAAISRFTAPMLNPTDESEAALTGQLQLVSDFYTASVLPASGHNRLWRSLQYQDMVRLHRSRYARSRVTHPLALLLATSEDYPTPPQSEGGSALEQLAVLANLRAQLEQHGPYRYTFIPIGKDQGGDAAPPPNRISSDLYRTAVSTFGAHGYLGSTLMQTSMALTYGGGLLLVTGLWVGSIAYAWGRLYGIPLRKRLWVTFLVGAAGWPISFIIFLKSAHRWAVKPSA